jgi:hypothetical protein
MHAQPLAQLRPYPDEPRTEATSRRKAGADLWVSLKDWLVRDGAVPALEVGQRLHGTTVRADCWSVHDGGDDDAVVDSVGDGVATVLPCSDVTGTVQWVQPSAGPYEGPVVTTLRVGDATLLMLGPPTELGGVDVGTRLTARCSLSIMHDHEWDTSAMPHVHGTWAVRGIRRSHWTTAPGRGDTGPLDVLEEAEISGLQPWMDGEWWDPRPGMFRLRLAPV